MKRTVLLLLPVLAACGGGGSSTPVAAYVFNKAQPACRVHQTAMPTAAYTGSFTSLTTLGFLQDYGPHATQAFCDGASANPYDAAWAAVYSRTGGQLGATVDETRPDLQP